MGHREKKGRKASINQQLFLFVFNNKENRVCSCDPVADWDVTDHITRTSKTFLQSVKKL